MYFHLVSLFPEIFDSFKSCSLLGKAIKSHKIKIVFHNLRDFGVGQNKQVDDKPFGGGSGMLLKPEPVFYALEHIKKKYSPNKIILLSPQGKIYNHQKCLELSKLDSLVLVCGRYQGVDARVNNFVDEIISIGSYILFGGEVPAMVLMETLARRIEGVINNQKSLEDETYQDNKISPEQYTRPVKFLNFKVPDILLSGNHQKIENWKEKKRIKIKKT